MKVKDCIKYALTVALGASVGAYYLHYARKVSKEEAEKLRMELTEYSFIQGPPGPKGDKGDTGPIGCPGTRVRVISKEAVPHGWPDGVEYHGGTPEMFMSYHRPDETPAVNDVVIFWDGSIYTCTSISENVDVNGDGNIKNQATWELRAEFITDINIEPLFKNLQQLRQDVMDLRGRGMP